MRRRVAKRRGGKKSGLSQGNQYATIVETLASNDIYSDQPYQSTFDLSQFFRATTIAKNFKYYRAKKVKWEYMPIYNTFQENNSVPAVGKPQMYIMMNRDQDTKFQNLTPSLALFSIQCAGADPFPFVKNKEIVYKPNWCSPGLSAFTTTPIQQPNPQVPTSGAWPGGPGFSTSSIPNAVYSLGMKKQYGWLPTPNDDAWQSPTAPNSALNPLNLAGSVMAPILNGGVVYNGHNLYVSQLNEPNVPIGTCVLTVEWEFKGGKQLFASAPPGTTTDQPAV